MNKKKIMKNMLSYKSPNINNSNNNNNHYITILLLWIII